MKIHSALGEKAKRCTHALSCSARINPTPVRCNAHGSKTESGGGDTGDVSMRFIHRGRISSRTVKHEPAVRIGLFPEITKGAVREVFKK